MSSILDKLNLRPQERRLVVIVGLVVFVVLNIWMVWPQFGQVAVWEQRRSDAEKNLKKFKDELSRNPEYDRSLKAMELLGGLVASEEQALSLMKEVTSEAALASVMVVNWNPSARTTSTRTNSYFDEQTLIITVNTGEKELVDFLYNLGSRNSLIRVKSMSLRPDTSQTRLQGEITLVESFQKKSKPAAAAASAPPKTTPVPVKATNPPAQPASVPPKDTSASATNTLSKTNTPRRSVPTPIPPKKT